MLSRMTLGSIVLATLLSSPVAGEQIVLNDVQVNLIDHVLVPAREAGVVAEVVARPGDYVRQNDVLAKMDETLVGVQIEAAAAETLMAKMATENDVDLRFAKKSHAFAATELQRSEEAVGAYAKSVSGSELDQARLAAERAALAAEQANRDLEANSVKLQLESTEQRLLETRLKMMQIDAPTDGVVAEVFAQAGSWVAAGAPVARIIRLDKLRVEGFVDGGRFDRDLLGAEVRLKVALPPNGKSTEFVGVVSFVSPEVNPVTGQVRFWADIDNPKLRLRPGTRGSITIKLNESDWQTATRTSRRFNLIK